MKADLGSLAKEVARRSTIDLGEETYKRHQETVNAFWTAIVEYFSALNVTGMKIYQDGMVVEGDVGRRIVEESSKSGSKNYELLMDLINRGAILVKTEDFKLVKEERDRLLAIVHTKSMLKRIIAFIRYKLVKNILLKKRDDFIAGRINETLNQGETGIIFIGAYHSIKVPKDIEIQNIKDAVKVREYQRLLPFYNRNKERVDELEGYLVSKI
jgi:hypothetical protein